MIVIVYPQFYGVGGIARYLQSFLAEVGDTRRRIVVITGDRDVRDVGLEGVEIVHLPMPPTRLGLVRWCLSARQWLHETAKKEKIFLINLHIPPLLPGLFLPRVAPIMVTAHTTYLGMSGRYHRPRQFQSQWNAASVALKMLFEKTIFAKATGINVLTEQGAREVSRYGYRGPVAIAPNGVSSDDFTPDASVDKDVDILFAGRIERRKGSRAMTAICRAMVEKNSAVRIHVVGYGDDEAYVRRELAPLSGNVVLTGKLPFEQILHEYRRSRLYASSSYYEGLPGTCLEAMASGIPAIVWDYAFYAGLVTDGVTGALIAPNDMEGFANTALQMLADRRRLDAMGCAARQNIESHYRWKTIAGDVMRIYEATAHQ